MSPPSSLRGQYVSHPDRGRLIALAVVTVVAFLFRHDHGVYIGLATLALLAILHWPNPRRVVMAVAEYSSITLLLMLPFLIFVQSTVGLLRYAGNAGALPLQIGAMPGLRPRPISRTVAASGPRVNVRWVDYVDADVRQELERKYELVSPEHVEGPTWSYVPMHVDWEHIGPLVDIPAVADLTALTGPGMCSKSSRRGFSNST